MMIKTLLEAPHYYTQVIQLIEKSFSYQPQFHFDIDFHPLMGPSNHTNCHLLIENSKIIGHIGVLPRILQHQGLQSKVILLGGICIDATFQGKGLFKNFFNSVINNYKEHSLAFLWSNLDQFYLKYDFIQAGHLYSHGNLDATTELLKEENFKPAELKSLPLSDKTTIYQLYQNQTKNMSTLVRDISDWKKIEMITSMKTYIKRDNKNNIEAYAFLGKGMDLTNILHEVIAKPDSDVSGLDKFKRWSPTTPTQDYQTLYGFLVKILNKELFEADLKVSITATDDFELIKTIFAKKLPVYIFGCDSI